ncbi:hypothetical protein GGI07_001119 [Coemansia sp. Benny D115]|nr:hypothetical protein GGI07_001119 [Coemansia sp. Benny D115]
MASRKTVVAIGTEPTHPISDSDKYVAGEMAQAQADFATLPLTQPLAADTLLAQECLSLDDVTVSTPTNAYCILGALSADPPMALREAQYAQHLGIRRLLLPMPGCGVGLAQYANLLLTLLVRGVPVMARIGADAWTTWNRVRQLCGGHAKLRVALVLTGEPGDLRQWRAEPVKLVVLAPDMFDAAPALSHRARNAVRMAVAMGAAISIQHTADQQKDLCRRVAYLRSLTVALVDDEVDEEDMMRDELQAPLQPLADHLEAEIYRTFEADQPKYEMYESAIALALGDLAGHRTPLAVVVAGAGQGPLVARALYASARARVPVRIVALEKNPGAMVTLQRRNRLEWGGKVELVHGDMRSYRPGSKADVLVSELLGSLGDNELAPECMAPAVAHILRPGGACIPSRYTAYIAPLSSTLLHQRAAGALETPYVVNIHSADVLCDPKPLWTFDHSPEAASKDDDGTVFTRFASVDFAAPGPSLVHGLAGYFDAVLYRGVRLSTCPATHTPDMYSWFPMFIPIKTPLPVGAGDRIAVSVWRQCTPGVRTWYEWAVETPGASSAIHNINAREYSIGQ